VVERSQDLAHYRSPCCFLMCESLLVVQWYWAIYSIMPVHSTCKPFTRGNCCCAWCSRELRAKAGETRIGGGRGQEGWQSRADDAVRGDKDSTGRFRGLGTWGLGAHTAHTCRIPRTTMTMLSSSFLEHKAGLDIW